jgi:hypothetical protein
MKPRPITESFIDENGKRVWRVPLTRGKFALVDDQDVELVRRYSWHWFEARNHAYTSTTDINGKQHGIGMHRIILDASPGQEIDHKNGDGLDNRRANIRFCTRAENLRNRRGWGKQKFKGVFRRKDGLYQARIFSVPYATAQEAAQAYDRETNLLFGEFAWFNDPEAVAKRS